MKIVIDRDIPYIRGVLEPFADVEYIKGSEISSFDVSKASAMIIRTRTKCDEELLQNSSVELIATATIGYDHIDMDYCRNKGVVVRTSAGCNARGVLQWVGAVLNYAAKQQKWSPSNKKIGIVGVGNVGSIVAKYAGLWGFEVLCCDPPKQKNLEMSPLGSEFVCFDQIVEQADIISFHVPLQMDGSDATYHLADKKFFENIKPNTLVINSSRGEVVDNKELARAIESRRCSGVVDTWENEPEIDLGVLGGALLATPHVAGYSAQGKANATSMAVQAVANHFDLPLKEWYPYDLVDKVAPIDITWHELQQSIEEYYDIAEDCKRLRLNPELFENLRNSYDYRDEYF